MRSAILFLLFGVSSQAASTLAFPSREPGAFLPIVMGVDHASPPSPKQYECTDYAGRKNFPHCYSGHEGSDFPIRGWFLGMEIGVDVAAAAPGTVIFTVDGNGDHCTYMPWSKHGIWCPDNPTMQANVVGIRQDDGLFAFYFHLKKDSIAVKPGDRVQTGDHLGLVGSSGYSSMPHLHFELRRLHTKPPFPPYSMTYGGIHAATNVVDPFAEHLWR